MVSGPRSDVGKILAMAVVLAVVVGWIAFPKGGKKIQWDSGLPAVPVERKTEPKGFEKQVLELRERLEGEAPRLPEEGGGDEVPEAPAADEKIGDPEEAATALDPKLREQIREVIDEASSKVEKFNEMTPGFERVEEVDRELLYKVMDERIFPRAANDIKSEGDVFHHVFSFIRSHTDGELVEMARGQELEYYQMMGNPEAHRGKVVDFRGRFVRVYQLIEWPAGEIARLPNTSGVRTSALCYCVGGKKRGQLHVLLTMTDPRNFASDDKIRCPAVFVKRWAGQMPNGDWVFFPLLVARDFKLMPKPRDRSTEAVAVGVAIFAAIGLIVIYMAARHEFSHSAEARSHLRDRLKDSRDKRLKKAKEAGGPMPWEKKKEPSEAGDEAGKEKPADEGGPGARPEEGKGGESVSKPPEADT